MQISSTPTAYGGAEAQRLLGMLLQQQGTAAGQDVPGSDTAVAPASASSQPAAGLSAAQFTQDTLSSLLSAQEGPPTSADIAAKVIGTADTNGDGSLSLDEVEQALGQDTTAGADALGQAFSKLDTNGDGQIDNSELTNALDTQQSASSASGPGQAHHAHHGHHAHGAGGASSTDMADKLLTDLDSNGDGELSSDEIQNALNQGSANSLTSAIGSLDTDGDGKLSASELSSAIDAFRSAHHYGASGTAATASNAQAVTA